MTADFVYTRTFEAPREVVWAAFTQQHHLIHWWGPKGFEMVKADVDLRPGSLFHYGMKAPSGATMWGKWTFREIDAPRHLAFDVAFSDEAGGETRHPMSPTWPLLMRSIVDLAEENGRTILRSTSRPEQATDEERATFVAGLVSMRHGFAGTYGQLDVYLQSLPSSEA